jgi:hypothetical protein
MLSNYLKIAVEGYEGFVLHGARSVLERKILYVVPVTEAEMRTPHLNHVSSPAAYASRQHKDRMASP